MDIKLSPPWYQYVKKVETMFKQDKDIKVEYDDDKNELTINVYKYEKAEALKKIMPKAMTFGNVEIKITIIYQKTIVQPLVEYYKTAFEGNPVFKYAFTFGDGTINYVVFEKAIAQFWNDDMSDPHGVTSMLYQDIANDIFGDKERIMFSTDSDQDNGWVKEYYEHNATPEEVKLWEYYNGEGSFENGCKIKNNEEITDVTDIKSFKSIFKYDKKKK